MDNVKYLLPETEIPTAWYNIAADLPVPLPPVIHPGTMKPIGPQDLAPIFPMAVIEQEVSTDRWIQIPEPVRDIYREYRRTQHAFRLDGISGSKVDRDAFTHQIETVRALWATVFETND